MNRIISAALLLLLCASPACFAFVDGDNDVHVEINVVNNIGYGNGFSGPASGAVALAERLAHDEVPVHALVDTVNAAIAASEHSWVAGASSRFDGLTLGHAKALCGALDDSHLRARMPARGLLEGDLSLDELPPSFDSRKAWPKCPTIAEIRDQGHCGSCWAFGAVEAFSDRLCIHQNVNVEISANDVLACCWTCGAGCDGGYPSAAWDYFFGAGNVDDSCDPYFDQKGCHHPGCEPAQPTPACKRQCTAKSDESWSKAKYRLDGKMPVTLSEEAEIMNEIYKNGPIESSFTVYEDFANYKSGVYKHTTGGVLGGHAIKIIGWGEDAKAGKYWVVANSWNKTWGMDGYFWIARGKNKCGLSDCASFPTPA